MNKIFGLLMMLSFLVIPISCVEDKSDLKQRKPKKEEDLNYLTTLRTVKIRSTPDMEGEVLEIIGDQTILQYLNDSTTFTTEIDLDGKKYDRSWYYVRSEKNNTGWIYGAFVQFLTTEEKEKISLLWSDQSKIVSKNSKTYSSPPKINQELFERYQSQLALIPKNDPDYFEKAFQIFENNIKPSKNVQADFTFLHYLNVQNKVLNEVVSRFNVSQFQFLYAEIKNYGRADIRTHTQLINFDKRGITLGVENKKVVFQVHLDKILRSYLTKLSQPMNDFLIQKEMETNWRKALAPQVNPSIKEMIKHFSFWDKFIVSHPFFPEINLAKQYRLNWFDQIMQLLPFKLNQNLEEEAFKNFERLAEAAISNKENLTKIKVQLQQNNYKVNLQLKEECDLVRQNLQ